MIHLDATPAAVGLARHQIDRLADRLSAEVLEDARLLVSAWAGLAIGLGLLLVFMPTSAFILTRYEDEKLERQVRWGILMLAALLLAIWLRS